MDKIICESDRLILREFRIDDASFIIRLVNTPGWLQFIGDRKIHTVQDAIRYLSNGPIQSYAENGWGLWAVILKETSTPIGMCGLLQREELNEPDIGFALLPEFYKKGFGHEAASATLTYGKDVLKLNKIVAITSPQNDRSIHLLQKLGFNFESERMLTEDKMVFLYSLVCN